MLERPLSRRSLIRYSGLAGASILSGYLLAACGDDDDDDDAGQAATATEEPMVDATATHEAMIDETPTEEMMAEATATEEMMSEPTATEEAMMEPTATEEMMAEPTPTEEMMAEETPTESMTDEMTRMLVSGWYRGGEVEYYDFGMNTPLTEGDSVATAPIWVLVHEMMAGEDPQFVEGQHNIVDVVPGDDGYSDLWQVMLVEVPDDYEADSIRDASEISEMAYPVTETEMYVNCPIVPEGTELEGGEPLVQGWYQGQEVYYPDFGMNPPFAIPIWAFITGMDSDGNPIFVEGQHNIIDAVPGDDGYSAFWRVNLVMVDDEYEPDSIRDAADVDEMYEITQTDLVVNCPVVVS
ncbi:MAG: hypothetical protein R3A46_10920 [Thermomicrobiales bacterium]